MTDCRIETDSLGQVKVPASAYYGAQTQRAMENFHISRRRMHREFVRAMGIIKCAPDIGNLVRFVHPNGCAGRKKMV